MNLHNKTVLITGASSGIGRSFAYLLGAKGANLVLVARTQSKLEEIAADIKLKHQVAVSVYAADLGVEDAARALYDQIQQDQVEVDMLINNAGFGKWGRLEDFTLMEYQQMVQLNITALTELCYLFLEDFKQQSSAGIINVGSTASFIPVPYSSVYAATKAYVLFFTEGLVGELRNTHVRVSCLCPGPTSSNFAAVANTTEQGKETYTPDPKSKTPDEVAQIGLDAFLAGKHYVLTDRQRQINLFKFLSRKRIINLVADFWEKRLGLNG